VALISLTNVSVDIPIYDIAGASLKKLLLGRAVGGRFGQHRSHVIVNALKNVSLEARDGDRIALVGNNGSGKTTLLRVLSDVYPPTRGIVHLEGRISPMFDATLGMSVDATGLENIRICGMLWGMSRAEIESSVEDVAEFTELGGYLNMPVRTYSMGMLLRLAFAVATIRDPEILLLDEVIGVGDATFFQKAFERLKQLVHRSRILVVASHSDLILRQLCNKAIWLQHGELMDYGDIDKVFTGYTLAGAHLVPGPAAGVAQTA
jgi:ABC-type polysaccharide/polyol phosphate transport system ATPase subunit